MNSIKELFVGEISEQAFRLIVRNYQNKVIRFIALFVQDFQVCEELASDVFLSLWNHRQQLSEVENLDSYIFIMAKNKALNHLRKRKVDLVDLDSFQVDVFHNTSTTPESIYISNEVVDTLNEVINELPHKTKMAFQLVREDKLKYKEAAEVLGVCDTTVYEIIRRIKQS
jgi:RNA polymerase sigma-70 factor (ECF subfamily)